MTRSVCRNFGGPEVQLSLRDEFISKDDCCPLLWAPLKEIDNPQTHLHFDLLPCNAFNLSTSTYTQYTPLLFMSFNFFQIICSSATVFPYVSLSLSQIHTHVFRLVASLNSNCRQLLFLSRSSFDLINYRVAILTFI